MGRGWKQLVDESLWLCPRSKHRVNRFPFKQVMLIRSMGMRCILCVVSVYMRDLLGMIDFWCVVLGPLRLDRRRLGMRWICLVHY